MNEKTRFYLDQLKEVVTLTKEQEELIDSIVELSFSEGRLYQLEKDTRVTNEMRIMQ